jgi:hypothetical protein
MSDISQDALCQEIERVYQTSLMRTYWRAIGRGLARLFGRKGEAPMWVSVMVAMAAVQGITIVIAAFIKDKTVALPAATQYFYPMMGYCWLSIIVLQTQLERFINFIKNDLVCALDLSASQHTMESWLRTAGRWSLQSFFILLFIAWMTLMTVFVIFNQRGQPAGIAIYLFTALVFLQTVPHLYWLLVISIVFAFTIRRLKVNLFPDDPSRTPVMQTMHQVSSNLLITVALLLALNIVLVIPLNIYSRAYLIAVISAFWTPLLLYFLLSESAFAHLLINARLQRLGTLQQQVMEIENNQDVSQKEPAEAVKRLLELHDRVKSAPVSMINLNSIANLLGSLALPLLAALLSIFDIWQKLFGTP